MITEPSWMEHAWREIGIAEFAGAADNPRIVEYHEACENRITDDEVPWCSSFVNYCMKKSSKQRTRSRAARTWMEWGVEITEPMYGCVCVLWRESIESWKGHVGFYIGEIDGSVLMLGGNQDNRVSVRRYPKQRVLGYRWI